MQYFRSRWLIWAVFLIAWSVALLTPQPSLIAKNLLQQNSLLACKVLHFCAYALLAVLTGWVALGRPIRWLLLGLVIGHAMVSEFLQQFVVSRTASWYDVAINCSGLVLGMALSWKWWLSTLQASLATKVADGVVPRPNRTKENKRS